MRNTNLFDVELKGLSLWAAVNLGIFFKSKRFIGNIIIIPFLILVAGLPLADAQASFQDQTSQLFPHNPDDYYSSQAAWGDFNNDGIINEIDFTIDTRHIYIKMISIGRNHKTIYPN